MTYSGDRSAKLAASSIAPAIVDRVEQSYEDFVCRNCASAKPLLILEYGLNDEDLTDHGHQVALLSRLRQRGEGAFRIAPNKKRITMLCTGAAVGAAL